MHKSAECASVPSEVKIKVICKECKLPGHTIDACPQRNDRDSYCQFCQAANAHVANSCEIAANISQLNEMEIAMNNMSLNKDMENNMTMARWASRNGMAQGQWQNNPTCYNCGNAGHLARNCPQGRAPPRGYDRRRGGFSRGRGYSGAQNGGYNNNQNSDYRNNPNSGYDNNNQNFNNRSFPRGGRGEMRGSRGNYRGRGNYQQPYQSRRNGYGNNPQPNPFYGNNPQTNPFLYPPFYGAGPNVPTLLFMNPQAMTGMQGQAQNLGNMQGSQRPLQNPTPAITMAENQSEN